jgi:hypothetical protein
MRSPSDLPDIWTTGGHVLSETFDSFFIAKADNQSVFPYCRRRAEPFPKRSAGCPTVTLLAR